MEPELHCKIDSSSDHLLDSPHSLHSTHLFKFGFVLGTAGLSAMIGFAAAVKARGTPELTDGTKVSSGSLTTPMSESDLYRSGVRLAIRALGRATLITLSTFGALWYVAWRCSRDTNLEHFRSKWFPASWRRSPSNNTNNIVTFDDLLRYLSLSDPAVNVPAVKKVDS
ncbi:unnamed protein product [Dicrocoelium dendriticum]|nr:unnamed protein product [Dicrocoelium dendriticum]